MYVCICRQITDNQIRELCRNSAASLADVRARLGVGNECGKCASLARAIVNECLDNSRFVNAA
ncbi:MAG: (2Fe-2S)-binding protein [Pseudohongiellaceae bacterium]